MSNSQSASMGSTSPSAVALTGVDIPLSTTGLGDFSNMPYMVVDPTNVMGATQGAGTVNVDGSWAATVTILYFGNNADVINDLNNDVMGLGSMPDGMGLKSMIQGLAGSYGADFNEFAFEVEAARPDQ